MILMANIFQTNENQEMTGMPRKKLIQGEHDKTVAHKFLETVFGVRKKIQEQNNKKEYTAGIPGMPKLDPMRRISSIQGSSKQQWFKRAASQSGNIVRQQSSYAKR